MLKDGLVPGYPKDSGEKALHLWCVIFFIKNMSDEDTPEQTDEKIFLLRPYVFACAKVSHIEASLMVVRHYLCPMESSQTTAV